MIERDEIEKRLIRLESETAELFKRLHERDKAWDQVRKAFIGIRDER